VALALALGGCGSGRDGKPAGRPHSRPVVKLGTKNFTEQLLLGELYAQALRAKGFRVEVKPSIGSSEIIDRTLVARKIDLYPEYTGVAAVVLALAVTPELARRHHLRSLADLRRLGPFRFGGAPENRARYQGLVGMRQAYGLSDARFVPVLLGRQYAMLDAGRADVVNVLSTDGQLERGRYVVLRDPKRIFGFQNAAPVVARSVLARQRPGFARTLDGVSARLTNRAMRWMNGAVDLDHRRPAAVARAFLRGEGLL
jgi:osmoprotectant transport system substrate-binding protein